MLVVIDQVERFGQGSKDHRYVDVRHTSQRIFNQAD